MLTLLIVTQTKILKNNIKISLVLGHGLKI
jgi:hypothetical protein